MASTFVMNETALVLGSLCFFLLGLKVGIEVGIEIHDLKKRTQKGGKT